MESTQPTLGEGIFSVSDASAILKLPSHVIRYAFNEYLDTVLSDTQKVFSISDTRYINFYSLIELYVFYALKERGVKKSKIVEAHRALRSQTDFKYPFAVEEIYTDGGTIFFGKDHPIITADKHLQFTFHELIEPYCSKIEFDKNSNIASRLYPLESSRNVVVDPKHQFGHPTIEGTNIKVSTLYNLYLGGDDLNFIAELYNLKDEQVKDAISFAKAA